MRLALVSLGCARTLVDSEVALGNLKSHGYQIVRDVSRADIAIVNTCGFIEEAKTESVETILHLCELKKKGRLKAVVVLGCLAQAHGAELKAELKEVDGIVGTDNFGNLAQLLEPIRQKNGKVYEVKAKPRFLLNHDTPRERLTPRHYAYVKISEGCINACSYCVIPKMKGPHRSRTVEDILQEIKNRTDQDPLSEINLIGQDTAAFGFDLNRRFQLPELLAKIVKLDRVPWVRFLYAHPGHVTDDLIDVIADSPSICRYVDLPIEHSHDAMLRRMNRGVTRDKMQWAIREFRKKVPGAVIRTTVIVGFPGETEGEFRDLMDFLKEVRFERLGAFKYSREEQSASYNYPGQIPDKLKEERLDAVMSQQQEIALRSNEERIGQTLKVLVEEKDSEGKDLYIGRSEFDAPEVDQEVVVRSGRSLKPGQFVDVKITAAYEYDLEGVAVD